MTITLVQLGDFYEAFGDQARLVADVCGLVLTSRCNVPGEPMCGFPVHSAATLFAELEAAGHQIEIKDTKEWLKEHPFQSAS